MLPSWFVPLVLVSSLVGWTMIIYTLVTMIKTKKAQRLAREAAAAAANGTTQPEVAPQP